jgi:tetratricopeptide (TPR) repeat protein
MQQSAQLEERISKCNDIISHNPDSLIFAALSDAYRKKGDLAKAFHVCNRGLKLHPDYGPGHLVMAKINMERGMYSEAEKELALAVEADGETRGTELLLAQILIKKGQTKEARKILKKLKVTDPGNQVVGELLEAVKQKAESGKPGYDVMTVQDRWRIEKVVDLKDGVHYLKSLPGVLGALAVGDKEAIGAAAAMITRCVANRVSRIGFGEYGQILVEAESLELWITRLKDHAFVLCCAPDASLGAIKVKVGELLEHLSGNVK